MRKQTLIILLLGIIQPLLSGVSAQWTVHDPLSYIQDLVNGGYMDENVLVNGKIHDLSKVYYDALKNVHPFIHDYRKARESVELSVRTVSEYNRTLSRLRGTGYHTPDQLAVFRLQQTGIMTGIASVLDDITAFMTNTGMSMSDKDRLDALDGGHARIVALFNRSRGLNMQMVGECNSASERKARKRLERELLR